MESSGEAEGQKQQTMSGLRGTAKEGSSTCSKGWLKGSIGQRQGPKDRSGNIGEIFLYNLKIFVRTSRTQNK